jgi:hypothetical protein
MAIGNNHRALVNGCRSVAIRLRHHNGISARRDTEAIETGIPRQPGAAIAEGNEHTFNTVGFTGPSFPDTVLVGIDKNPPLDAAESTRCAGRSRRW